MIHLDVKNSFLNGTLYEEIYLEVPNGIQLDGKNDNFFRLKKALYGLKQVVRALKKKLEGFPIELNFMNSHDDLRVFLLMSDGDVVLLLVYWQQT